MAENKDHFAPDSSFLVRDAGRKHLGSIPGVRGVDLMARAA